MKCKQEVFGKLPDGSEVQLFSFECKDGLRVGITNYGGIITSVRMPDRNGVLSEITAGFSDLPSYLKPHPYFGALVGRYAGRIAYGKLHVHNELYQLNLHDAHCHLHGGDGGFHTRLWNAAMHEQSGEARLTLRYLSPHLEENYPAELEVTATYIIRDNNSIQLEFQAVANRPTHLNLANHAYFNLNGFVAGVGDHTLQVEADAMVELNSNMLPTGKLLTLDNHLLDFREAVTLQSRNIPNLHELDHCYVLRKLPDHVPALVCTHAPSGRSLRVYTTQPGVQIYSGNFLDGSLAGHGGTCYYKHAAICFETQHFADSPNQPHFPSTLLEPGKTFYQSTTYAFNIV